MQGSQNSSRGYETQILNMPRTLTSQESPLEEVHVPPVLTVHNTNLYLTTLTSNIVLTWSTTLTSLDLQSWSHLTSNLDLTWPPTSTSLQGGGGGGIEELPISNCCIYQPNHLLTHLNRWWNSNGAIFQYNLWNGRQTNKQTYLWVVCGMVSVASDRTKILLRIWRHLNTCQSLLRQNIRHSACWECCLLLLFSYFIKNYQQSVSQLVI